jgi:signal recognition particle subunit SRP54
MASRILGMGDVLSFIDKAQNMIDEDKAKQLEEKIKNQEFDLNDFLDQIHQIEEMGSLNSLLEMMPGANKKALKGLDLSGASTKQTEAIILSMTNEERRKPGIINASRRKRIATGSGTSVSDVNRLLKGFEQSRKLMKQMSNPNVSKKGRFKLPFM